MEENKEYYHQLQEEYNIPIPENATEEEVYEWAVKTKKQINFLIENYGESSWNIHRFMELCRAEDISESYFRQLVRQEIDKCLNRIRTNEYNTNKSNLIWKRLNTMKGYGNSLKTAILQHIEKVF